jgi:hypothetical protein
MALPAKRLTTGDFFNTWWFVTFLVFVLAADAGLFLADIYLESGGFKLAFPGFTWPAEIKGLFLLMGIPPKLLTPPVVLGFVMTVTAIASSFIFAHYGVSVVFSGQQSLKRSIRTWQDKNYDALIDEAYPLLRTILFACVIGALMYLYIFPRWTVPFAQLQLADKFWGDVSGDAIARQALPDVGRLLDEHEGEFSWYVVASFPYALMALHILIALLTELFLLHAATHLESFAERHDEVIRNLRSRMKGTFRRNRPATHETIPAPPTHTDEPATGSCDTPSEEPCTEEHPEDRPVRVIGGSETITPREAMTRPDLYEVIKARGDEGVYYVIYTREFYQRMEGRAA